MWNYIQDFGNGSSEDPGIFSQYVTEGGGGNSRGGEGSGRDRSKIRIKHNSTSITASATVVKSTVVGERQAVAQAAMLEVRSVVLGGSSEGMRGRNMGRKKHLRCNNCTKIGHTAEVCRMLPAIEAIPKPDITTKRHKQKVYVEASMNSRRARSISSSSCSSRNSSISTSSIGSAVGASEIVEVSEVVVSELRVNVCVGGGGRGRNMARSKRIRCSNCSKIGHTAMICDMLPSTATIPQASEAYDNASKLKAHPYAVSSGKRTSSSNGSSNSNSNSSISSGSNNISSSSGARTCKNCMKIGHTAEDCDAGQTIPKIPKYSLPYEYLLDLKKFTESSLIYESNRKSSCISNSSSTISSSSISNSSSSVVPGSAIGASGILEAPAVRAATSEVAATAVVDVSAGCGGYDRSHSKGQRKRLRCSNCSKIGHTAMICDMLPSTATIPQAS